MMMKASALFLVLMLSLLLCAWPSGTSAVGPTLRASEGDEVEFKLKGLDGQTYDLEAMRGNVLLVSFGATWCQPCQSELRALEELKKEYSGKPVKILWVSIEGEDEISDQRLRQYAKGQKLTFPVLRDKAKLTYAQFSTRVRIPLVVFFDREGHLARPVQFGMATPEMYKTRMRERLNQLLTARG